MSSNKKNPFLTYINCWKDKNKRFPTFLVTLFVLGLLVAILEFIIVVFFAQHPHILNFSVFHQNYSDSFADFFNINSFTRYSSPYLNGSDSSYPPLNFLFALPFVWSREEKNLPFSRNSSWQTWASLLLLFAIFIAMTVILLFLFYKKYKPSKSVLIFIILAHVLSSPILFLVERANYLYFTFFFVGIFLLCYNSSKRYLQYVGFISLAIAVGMKMYPAIFALLLLKERRYKDLLITAGLSIVAFFLPFCFFKGGIQNCRFIHLRPLSPRHPGTDQRTHRW